jgi:cytochrome b
VKNTIKVWDLPIRVFHWLLLALVVFSFISIKIGGNWVQYHEYSGYAILTLLLFRLAWGLIGSQTARFSDFVTSPANTLRYLKGQAAKASLGHNPLGAWSVLGLLFVLLLQATTGLIIDDEIATKGPLADKVPAAWVALATTIHRINEKVILALVALHIIAIIVYTRRGEKLINAMWTGLKVSEAHQPKLASLSLALVTLLVAAGVVYWLVRVYP